MATAKPKFLYDNRLNDGTPVASTTATGNYNVLNLLDFRPFTWWKPTSLPATVDVDSGVARAADYALIYGHDLHDAQVAVEVRGSTDNFAASDVLLATSNLLAYPEQFDNGAWTKADVTVTANAMMAPDGKHTMDKLVETATTAQHFANQASGVNGTQYAFSVRAKAAERTWLRLANGQGAFSVWFNLANGTVGTNSSPGDVTATIESLGDGVYECTVTNIMDVTAAVYVFLADADASVSYLGDVTKGLYVWGAQHKFGSSAGYYEGAANGPLYLPFASASFRYWRLRFVQLTGSVMPQIAIAPVGQALDADQYISAPFDPLGAELVGQFNRSQKGHPLGSVIDFESYARTIELEDVSWTWYRDSFRPAWAAHLRHKPFGFVWDPTDHANEIVLVTATPLGHDIPHRAGGYATLRLPVSGKIT